MTPESISQQLVMISWGGINATQTCGFKTLPHLQLPLSQTDSHAPIVVGLATMLRTALFASHLHNLLVSNYSTEEYPSSVTTAEVTNLVGHARNSSRAPIALANFSRVCMPRSACTRDVTCELYCSKINFKYVCVQIDYSTLRGLKFSGASISITSSHLACVLLPSCPTVCRM